MICPRSKESRSSHNKDPTEIPNQLVDCMQRSELLSEDDNHQELPSIQPAQPISKETLQLAIIEKPATTQDTVTLKSILGIASYCPCQQNSRHRTEQDEADILAILFA